MEIKKFCEEFNHESVDKIMNDDLYISYGMKILTCKEIVKSSSTNPNTGEIELSTPMRNLLFKKRIVEMYTELEFTRGDGSAMMNEYDMLNRHRIIDEIIGKIPETEYNEFLMILNQSTSDYIETLKINNSFTGMLRSIAPLVEEMKPLLEQLEKGTDN